MTPALCLYAMAGIRHPPPWRAGTSMGKQVPSPTFPVLMLDMDGLTIV
jgi:hypothetical protein